MAERREPSDAPEPQADEASGTPSAPASDGYLGDSVARMLVNRGVEAILNAHRAELAVPYDADPEG